MNIVIFGAGAIGSLFGAFLSKKNNVVLIGRTDHVDTIQKNGLTIQGKTHLNVEISAEDSVDKINIKPDLVILCVKSYDTQSAMLEVKKIIDEDTYVLSLQNGLDNIDNISKMVKSDRIIAGVTTHGVLFFNSGVVRHTGFGETIIGSISGNRTSGISNISDIFNDVDVDTKISINIVKEIWAKAVVNSSINPLTTFFNCKNGYLVENKIVKYILKRVCKESTYVANKHGVGLSFDNMYSRTLDVIKNTADNESSMLQSIKKNGRTEIDSINGKIIEIGKNYGVETFLNEVLVYLVNNLSK